MKQTVILPRFLRLRDAPAYLGMDKNRFNREVRPFVIQLPMGKQGIAFDRLDLDQWAEQYKQRVSRPKLPDGGKLWAEKLNPKRQGSSNAASTGTLIKKSLDSELQNLLERPLIKKPS